MPARADFNPHQATVGELVCEVLRLRADLATTAANVVQAAIERGWCNEYEQWARITNRQLSRPHMIERHDLEHNPSMDESGRWNAQVRTPEPTLAVPAPVSFPPDGVYRNPQTGEAWCPTCQAYHGG